MVPYPKSSKTQLQQHKQCWCTHTRATHAWVSFFSLCVGFWNISSFSLHRFDHSSVILSKAPFIILKNKEYLAVDFYFLNQPSEKFPFDFFRMMRWLFKQCMRTFINTIFFLKKNNHLLSVFHSFAPNAQIDLWLMNWFT